jgi:DNA polymerase III sliding clamp (beta) subunit (PCNA family)
MSILKDGRMAATDGHRLHVAPLQCSAGSDMLIPRDAAITLSSILKAGKELLVKVREEQASFSVGGICLVTTMPQTQFPPIDQVIPEKSSNVFVRSSKLLKAIQKLDSLQNEHDATIIETTDLGVLRLSFEDRDNGATEVEIGATFADSASRKIGANSTYLIDALAVGDCEADISIGGPLDPIRIDCDSYIAVVMPMRI